MKQQHEQQQKIILGLVVRYNKMSSTSNITIKGFYDAQIRHLYGSFITYESFRKARQRIMKKRKVDGSNNQQKKNNPPKKRMKTIYRDSSTTHKQRKNNLSPMHEVETILSDMIVLSARLYNPMDKPAIIGEANNIIANSKTLQNKILADKKRRFKDKPELWVATVGHNWYHAFRKRKEDVLKSTKIEDFSSDRKDWVNTKNVSLMYDMHYEAYVKNGIADKLPEAVFFDIDGNEISQLDMLTKVKHAVGRASKYKMINPDYLMFMDETGTNTNTANDGEVGGQVHVSSTEEKNKPKKAGSRKDCRWTTMGFTASSALPILCVIIIQKKSELTAGEVLGVELGIDLVEEDILENFGTGKRFPGGPKCFFRGKFLETLVFHSESGGVTPEILVDILRYLDAKNIFPRTVLPDGRTLTPTLQVDAHCSRFALEFMRYVLSPDHRWDVRFGLPNGTHCTQVGDSNEQNGSFKIAVYKEKQNRIQYRIKNNLGPDLQRTDIVPIVLKSWPKSFGNQTNNKKAIAERGWNPLSYTLLDSDEVKKGDGLADDTLSSIMQSPTMKNFVSAANGKINFKRKKEASSEKLDKEFLGNGFKLTGGNLYMFGQCGIEQNLVDFVTRKQDEKSTKDEKNVIDAICKYYDLETSYEQTKKKYKTSDLHSVSSKLTDIELKNLVSRKIRKKHNDPVISSLKNKGQKLKQWNIVHFRPDLSLFEYLESEKDISKQMVCDVYSSITGKDASSMTDEDLKTVSYSYMKEHKKSKEKKDALSTESAQEKKKATATIDGGRSNVDVTQTVHENDVEFSHSVDKVSDSVNI